MSTAILIFTNDDEGIDAFQQSLRALLCLQFLHSGLFAQADTNRMRPLRHAGEVEIHLIADPSLRNL